MPRRYRRSGLAMFEKTAVGVRDFPSGQGPPLYLSLSFAECASLGPGRGAFVPFDGTGGAICHGLHTTRAVVLVRFGAHVSADLAAPGPNDGTDSVEAGVRGGDTKGASGGGTAGEPGGSEGGAGRARIETVDPGEAPAGGRRTTGAAYCLHAAAGPLDPAPLHRALDVLGRPSPGADDLFVVVASRGEVTEREERFFISLGIAPEHVFTYSNCHLPQFGVSGRGRVGEAR